jgi:2-dehydropantoate 2-reductase
VRIAVLGAGAVGGTLAALLARAGHEVTVTARGENLDAIRRGGLRLEGGFGE